MISTQRLNDYIILRNLAQKYPQHKLMVFELNIGGERESFENIETLSEYVSDILDNVGYGKYIVDLRRNFWRELDKKRTNKFKKDTRITTGSKGEGFSVTYESDTDRLYVYKYAICRFPGDKKHDTKYFSEFILQQVSAGYYKLKLEAFSKEVQPLHRIEKALVDSNGEKFISNKRYTTGLMSDAKSILSGPAASESYEYLSWDYVNAFRCTSQQNILLKWTLRDRKHGWPSQTLIQEINDQEAQMVPVGFKVSKEKDIEWRVCFVQGEQKLTDSWNEFQYKVYILLKQIKTCFFKPICDEISSFIMKNVTFWYVEQNSIDKFSKQNLLTNVFACLAKLKDAIIQTHLPYYFISERNLLQERIADPEQQQLTDQLDDLIEHPMQIFKCPKLQSALTVTRSELAEKGRWRDNLEELYLKSANIWRKDIPCDKEKEATRELMEDIRLYSVCDEIRDMVWPAWREYDGKDRYEELARRVMKELS